MMKVILTNDVKHVGRKGDIVNVKDGYFLNFLLPSALAEVATLGRLKVATARLENRTKKIGELKSQADSLQKSLSGKVFELKAKTTGKSTLYASITEKDIVEAIKADMNVELDASNIIMSEHFKKTGKHDFVIHLAEGVEAKAVANVEAL